ncbi:class F sortase [Kribbella turkmenica]|uniref:Class F sortase n=1 Tax=Kribbella turkmenica TaxID=2530375 RepID=A0A4R4WC43_9ACTN|nr:class F sortase [Kribbella turkmenica]
MGVTISSLSVEAVVVPVGVAADGSLMLPEPSTVGWWIGGAQPGDARGTTVLAGHVDADDGSQGALYDLSSVHGGDTIRIATAAGPLTYRVVALHNYRRQHLPKQLFDQRGPHRLAVITCGGSYDPRRGYSSNVVAYAVPARA